MSGLLGAFFVARQGHRREQEEDAELTDPAALEIRRLRRMIANIVVVGLAVGVVVLVVWTTDRADERAERKADELVRCVLAGREDC